jgi:Ca2+-binding EF-hand superfamily protein
VFGKRALEKEPLAGTDKANLVSHLFEKGEVQLTPQETQELENAIKELKHHILIRQMHTKSFFQDFDILCTGYVSQTQLRRCLTYLKTQVSDDTFKLLVKKWGRKGGLFYYLPLIKALEPSLDQGTTFEYQITM